MDRLPRDSPVILLGTARNPDLIDSALRSGTVFGKEVELPVPSVEGRLDILHKLLQPFVHSLQPEDLEKVAEETHGFVGGDLEGVRMSAFRLAGKFAPTRTHFAEALKTASPSAMKSIQLEIPHVNSTLSFLPFSSSLTNAYKIQCCLFYAGAMGGYWWTARVEAPAAAGRGVAIKTSRILRASRLDSAQRSPHVRATRLLQNNDSKGTCHREWS